MVFKINLSEKGKTYKFELDSEALLGKKIGDKLDGNELKSDLAGYHLELTGTSDKAGFPGRKEIEGSALKKVLLKYGMGMWKKPRKEGKRTRGNLKPKGLRLKKTVRGNSISRDTIQINFNVLKEGPKKLTEIFPEQNKPKEAKGEAKN